MRDTTTPPHPTPADPIVKRRPGRPKGIHTKRTIDPSIPPYGLTPSSRISVAKEPDPRSARARRPAPVVDRTLGSPELEAAGLCVSLEGTPHARPEPRGWKGTARVVNAPKKVRKYIAALERQIRTAVANVGGDAVVRATLAGRPLLVRIVWSFPTKNEDRWGEPHLFKPDVDNLEKLVLDCLKRAGGFGGSDDALVARVEKSKEWDLSGWLWVLVKPLGPNQRSGPVPKRRPNKKSRHEGSAESLQSAPSWLRR